MERYVAVGGQRYGPYTEEQFDTFLAQNQVPSDAQVWLAERGTWVPAAELLPRQVPLAAPAGLAAAHPPGAWPAVPAYPAQQVAVPAGRGNGWAVAALVLGIVALAVCWIPVLNMLSVVLGLIGVVLAIPALVKARKNASGMGMAVTALVLSLVAIVASFAIGAAFVGTVDTAIKETEAQGEAVKIVLGEATGTAVTTTLNATVTNTNQGEVTGGMFTVQAQDAGGTVLAETTGTLPTMKPGQSAKVAVVFFEKVPAGARYVVTDVSAFTL